MHKASSPVKGHRLRLFRIPALVCFAVRIVVAQPRGFGTGIFTGSSEPRLWLHYGLTYQMIREGWWRSWEGALDDALMRSMPHHTAPGARASPSVKWSCRFQVECLMMQLLVDVRRHDSGRSDTRRRSDTVGYVVSLAQRPTDDWT